VSQAGEVETDFAGAGDRLFVQLPASMMPGLAAVTAAGASDPIA